MSVSFARLRATLSTFDWNEMFVELGWSHTRKRPDAVVVDDQIWTLAPIAELGGMVVYRCTSDTDLLPPSDIRRKLENKIKDVQFEHIIIFEDGARRHAVFQWIKRGEGAARSREFGVERTERGELLRGEHLLQRLSGIAFDFDDLDAEGKISIQSVLSKIAKSLDVETVTKRFYDEFTKQRDAFQTFIHGIPVDDDQRWYVSVMLNRLMFMYFIQSKQFLDNDRRYLQHKLEVSQSQGGNLFYRDFLQVLFFKGFAQPKRERDAATQRLLGNVPYLNGGLFLPHSLEERYGAAITIPDAAFAKLFGFFDKWRWHLNERPGGDDRAIDPDVLGYIFEKYINQKQMGAYYTKEDITGYICRNTIIPALFDKADLPLDLLDLPRTIEAYIYPAVKQSERLPTETDREYAVRQKRKEQLVADGQAGKIATINDAITANLNVEAMAFDLVPFLDARQLWSLYNALNSLSVLDPTCGSGAFLFAAIKILKPLYEQALDRMALLVERRKTDGFAFKQILDAEQEHANREYFITKSIVVRNLYGVDIMEEATEVCKLRLFLRLVADLNDEDADHIEPLPDIDFNIRAGNALVGYASIDEIGGVVKQGGLAQLSLRQQRLLVDVQAIQHGLSVYRQGQLQYNPSGEVFRQARQEIRTKLRDVDAALDDDLLKTRQITRDGNGTYNTQPFHWFTAFYDILHNGGFDVIVGNPPYVLTSEINYSLHGYSTAPCGDIYAPCVERSLRALLDYNGRFSMIIPVSSVSTESYQPIREVYRLSNRTYYAANFGVRPSKLFDGADKRLTVLTATSANDGFFVYSTTYKRWVAEERPHLFETIQYLAVTPDTLGVNGFPKISRPVEAAILDKIRSSTKKMGNYFVKQSSFPVSYTRKLQYFIQFFIDPPRIYDSQDKLVLPSELKKFFVKSEQDRNTIIAILNSNLFFWYFIAFSDCRNVNTREIIQFPVDLERMNKQVALQLGELGKALLRDLQSHAIFQKRNDKRAGLLKIESFQPRHSKPIIDEIDRVLAQHYGFTDEELNFIINYDIKYRMGKDAEEAEA